MFCRNKHNEEREWWAERKENFSFNNVERGTFQETFMALKMIVCQGIEHIRVIFTH